VRRISQQVAVGATFAVSLFMSIMDTTVVNTALPTLARDFHTGTSGIDWVVISYLLSLAIWIPASGWIGDRVGTKRVLLFALAVFTVGSALCGLAQSLGQLIAFRVLQGVGGGMLAPVGTAMLFRVFPPEQRARASQVLIVPTAAAPAMGPVLGGLLVEHLSWRWVFMVNVPVGVLAFAFGWITIAEHREPAARARFDLAGFLLSGCGLALLLYAISEGASRGWASPEILSTGIGGLATLAAFTRVELARDHPMLDLRVLGDRLFRTSNLVCLFAYGSFLGLLYVMPQFLQEAVGVGPFQSGLTTFPEAIGVITSTQLVGWLYHRVGPRRLMAGGLVAMGGLEVSMAFLGADASLWTVRLLMLATGAAMAYVIMPQQAATFATITPADTGQASAIYNTQRQVAAALGVAVLATVLTATSHGSDAATSIPASAFHPVFIAAAAIAALGVAVALTIRDTDAASTMDRRGSDQRQRPQVVDGAAGA
jgi:EmrB/QacA subfamily drug resistance transporter